MSADNAPWLCRNAPGHGKNDESSGTYGSNNYNLPGIKEKEGKEQDEYRNGTLPYIVFPQLAEFGRCSSTQNNS